MRVKTVFSLTLHLSFETLALLHKNFKNLLENVMIIPCKWVIRKCEPVNCESNNLRVVSKLTSNLRAICLRVVKYISVYIVSSPQMWQSKFVLKVLFYSRWNMLKIPHVSSSWFLYFPSQIFKNVIAILAAPGSSSIFPRDGFK